MVHVQVSEAYIQSALMYTADHILLVLPIKVVINKDGNPTMPFKLATCTKPSISHFCYSIYPCVLQKSAAHVGTKASTRRYQAQKGFCGIFTGII